MVRLVNENEWLPVGVADLEPNAELVVRSKGNRLVVAGPGAGKTELLAQRANFLLETGVCLAPKRILAIAFKRDAAKNLDERVRERCEERAPRFDSMTLDAFAKQLVDRFLPALPTEWRPRIDYEVRASGVPISEARPWLAKAAVPLGQDRPDVEGFSKERARAVFDAVMHGAELPYAHTHELQRSWGAQWWQEQLRCPGGQPSITFPMLNRLAAYLLRANLKILTALQLTYSHVFLDEFQDTTASQWDLVRTAFMGSDTTMTAVGDGKQRIMVWAGAMTDAFERFEEDFASERSGLVRNYRSVPELVRMQNVIAQAVEAAAAEQIAVSSRESIGSCSVLEFRNPEQEATYLADLIQEEIASGRAFPRDFCVMVRQSVGEMVALLRDELAGRGLVLRDESKLQDLRAEPVTGVVLPALRLATAERDAHAWEALLHEVHLLSGLDEDVDGADLEGIATAHKRCVAESLSNDDGLRGIPRQIVEILGSGCYRARYRQYAKGDYLDKVVTDLGDVLQLSLDSIGDASAVADDIVGVNAVPAMTIHKSKGLEFATVIFLGLEDGQWWAFRDQPDEEKRAFFVAFSRGIERVIFTFSDERDGKWRRSRQKREEVDALHDILHQAGVQAVNLRG